ncbi:MAG: hypothetical protein JNN07_01135 [Verrucomicrobiales bacterium]|nr:hypothetical protein [Verrucomicrobiales bacterium]
MKKRQITWVMVGTTGLLVLVVVPGLVFLIWRSGISQDIGDLERKARQAGEPITVKELATWHKAPPDDENILIPLIALWEKEDERYWKAVRERAETLPDREPLDVPSALPLLGTEGGRVSSQLPWTSNQVALVREFEDTHRDRALRVRQALTLPKAHFPSSTTVKLSDQLPHLPFLKQESQRLFLRSLLSAHDRDGAASLEAIEQMLKVAECLREEPSSLSQLVRFAILNIAFNALESTVAYAALTSAQLDRAEHLFSSLTLSKSLYQAWIGERVLALRAFNAPIAELGGQSQSVTNADFFVERVGERLTLSRSPMNALGFVSLDHRLLLQTFDALLGLNRNGRWEDIVKSETVIAEAITRADSFPPKIFSSMTLSGQERVARRLLGAEARRRSALLALAVERHRLAHGGAVPETLEALITSGTVADLNDPFDGKRLRYRIKPQGYVVYSVGPDRQDQGGTTIAPSGKPDAFDFSFTVVWE